ncbi:MAG: MFS transporter [Candidatus Aramenus sp.]|nr:MFS transporter [Candidatus Aramenus sp.]
MKLVKALRENKGYRYYWLATSLMHVSGVMYTIAVAYLLLRLSTPLYAGVSGISMVISALAPFPSGFLADRVNRKRTLVLLRVLQGVFIISSSFGVPALVVSYLAVTFLVSFSSPFSAGIIQSVLKRGEVIGATSLNSLTISLFSLTGGVLALAFPFLGTLTYLFLISATRVLSAVFISLIPLSKGRVEKESLSLSNMKLSILVFSVAFAFVGIAPVIVNSYAFDVFKDEQSLALVSAFTTVGSGVGAFLSSRFSERFLFSTATLGALGLGVTMISMSLFKDYAVFTLVAIRGIFTSFQNVSWRSIMRLNVPNQVMGRVWGSVKTLSSILGGAFSVVYSAFSVYPGTALDILGFLIILFGILLIGIGRNSKKDLGVLRPLPSAEGKSED